VLEVTAQNIPCKNLAVYHPQVPKLVYGRRGVVAVVVTMGTISPGDLVRIGP
jgi:MOSC domain-containing protein YiiM